MTARITLHRRAAALPLAGLFVGLALAGSAVLAQPAPPAADAASAAAAASTGAAAPPPVLPLKAFASLPLITGVTLSPNGQQIAALLNEPERTVLIVRAVSDTKARPVLTTDNQEFQINWARWVNHERLLVSVRFASRRDFVATMETRLLSIKSDGTDAVNLVVNRPLSGSVGGIVRTQQIQDQVIDWLPEDGQHVLLQLADGKRALPGVYKVNVETATRSMVKGPERDVREWITDAQHRVRIGVRRTEEKVEIRACDPDGTAWRTLWTFDGSADELRPLGFGLDPQELFVIADHEGRAAVFSVRLDQPELPRKLRLSHPAFDVAGELLRSPASGEVIGLQTAITDDGSGGEARSDLWAPSWRALAQAVDKGLPRRDNRLVGISRDEKRYLVDSFGNGQPHEFFIGDRSSGELSLLAQTYPDLKPADLAGKKPVAIKARDGLDLRAFLTLPKGRAPTALPFVMLPHGGPQGQDHFGFDHWTELLANRGYGVLQVNFRGSEGQGRAFENAGLQRWGLEMQDDLSDALQWAVAQGIADPSRVCIVGASYGGYAALMGVVKTPALYRCAVSFAGVTDLPALVAHVSEYIGGARAVGRLIGRAWSDRERLRATSPALQAERIRVPVLLVHGTADRSVPVEQSEAMATALRRAGKPFRYIEQEGGDHYLSRNAHRLEFFEAMDGFLAEQLQPQAK